jgi:hypothetical protein
MTHEELVAEIERLRDQARYVDVDIASILAVVHRTIRAGDDLSELAQACFDVEQRSQDRLSARRRPGKKRQEA